MPAWSGIVFTLSASLSVQALRLGQDVFRRDVADHIGQIVYIYGNQSQYFVDAWIDTVPVSVLLDTTA